MSKKPKGKNEEKDETDRRQKDRPIRGEDRRQTPDRRQGKRPWFGPNGILTGKNKRLWDRPLIGPGGILLGPKRTVAFVGGTTLAMGAVLTRDIEPDNMLEPTGIVAEADEEDLRPRRMPTRSSRPFVQQIKTERYEAPKLPTHIGTLLDTKPEDFANFNFAITENGEGKKLVAIPQQQERGVKEVRYDVSQEDPINLLSNTATQKQISLLLEATREAFREDRDVPHFGKHLPYKPRSTTATHLPTGEFSDRVDVTPINEDGKVILRIDLGYAGSQESRWLDQLLNTPNDLVRGIESDPLHNDAFTRFVRDTIVNPETEAVDYEALFTLQRIFSLKDEDRKAFTDAMGSNNTDRVNEILTFRSAKQPMDEDTFRAFSNYVEKAKRAGITQEKLQEEISLLTYGNIPHKDMPTYEFFEGDGITAQALHDSTSPEQFKKLVSAPDELLVHLADMLYEKGHATHYHEALDSYKKMALEEESFTAPPRVLDLVKQHLYDFMGDSRPGSGWINSHDRQRNFLSVMGLVSHHAQLKNLGGNGEGSPVDHLIQNHNGHNYFTVEIPTGNIEEANRLLALIGRTMRAMHYNQEVLGNERKQDGTLKELRDRLAEFFAEEAGPTELQYSTLAAARDLIKPLASSQPPPEEIMTAVMDKNPDSEVRISGEELAANGTRVSTIERAPKKEETQHAGAEVAQLDARAIYPDDKASDSFTIRLGNAASNDRLSR